MNRYLTIAAAAWAVACSPVVDGGFGDTGATLRGRIVRADGQGVAGMRVHVRGPEGRELLATSDGQGAFSVSDPPVGAVRLVGHDGRGGGLLVDAALIDGGDNDVGELRLRPLAELPSMVTVSGLGLEERVTNLTGDCRFPIFSADHLRAYCLRTLGDSALAHLVEIDVATGAERVLGGDDDPLRVDAVCSAQPLRLEDQRVLMGAFADQTVAVTLSGAYERSRRRNDPGLCESSLDAVADQSFLHWLDYGSDIDLDADRLDSSVMSSSPSTIDVPNSQDRYANLHELVAVSPTHLAMRLNIHDPAVGPTDATLYDIHVFDLVARTVSVVHADHAVGAAAFVNGELRVLGPTGIVAYDAQGVERSILAVDLGLEPVAFYAAERGSAQGVAVIRQDLPFGGRAWRVDFVAGTLTPFPELLHVDGGEAGHDIMFPYDHRAYRGWRALSGGDIAITTFITDTTTGAPGRSALMEYHLDGDGTGIIRMYEGARDDGQSGPLSRVMSPDGARTALLVVDPATGFRQVHEGVASSPVPEQRTFIAGSHTALDYAADGSAIHFFAYDPLSGYIQLFRLSTAETAPPP